MKNIALNFIKFNKKHFLFIFLLFAVISISFLKISFLNFVPEASDTVQWRTSANSMLEFNKTHNEQAQWNSNVFGGMPGYMISFGAKWPFVNSLRKYVNKVINWRSFQLFTGAVGIYLLMLYFGFSPLISFIAAISFAFSTHFIGLIEIGHNPKFRAILLIPWIFLSLEYLKRENNLLGMGLLAIFVTNQLRENHPQISYYTFLFIGLYWVYYLYFSIKNSEWKKFSIFSIFLFFAFFLSFLAIAQPYFSTYEYGHYTIRGGAEGLSTEYATSWSFNPAEILSFIVPSFFGGTNVYYWGWMPFTQTSMYMGILIFMFATFGISNGKNQTKLFLIIASIFSLLFSFGRHFPLLSNFLLKFMPFFNKFRVPATTLVILEFTIIVLAGFGLKYIIEAIKSDDEKFKKYLFNSIKIFAISGILFFIIYGALKGSQFSKQDILAKAQINTKQYLLFLMAIDLIVPFLYLILAPIFSRLKKNIQTKQIILIILSIVIIFLMFSSILHHKPLVHDSDLGRYKKVSKIQQVIDRRLELMAKDATISYILILATLLLLFAYSKKKLNLTTVLIIIAILNFGDLFNQRMKFLKNVVPAKSMKQKNYTKNSVDKWLEKDDELFRIYPLANDFQKNKWTAFNQSIGGYHGAKLKRYQEIIENCLNVELINEIPINWNIVNMLNAKYILFPSSLPFANLKYEDFFADEKITVMKNLDYLPRAWFVENVETITEPDKIFARMNQRSFNPAKTAIIEQNIEEINYPDSSSVLVTNHSLHNISFDVETDKQSFLTVSEVYYPAGWQAFIDGKKTEIFATNYILRGIIVPEGSHKIDFKFISPTYNISVKLSLIGILSILILTFIGLILVIRHNYSGKVEYVLKLEDK